MSEECISYPEYLSNDPLFKQIIDREAERCNIDFHGLIIQGEHGFKELNKQIALYLQLPNEEAETCPSTFVSSVSFPVALTNSNIIYALEPNKAKQFIQARGNEIRDLMIQHIIDLQEFLDIIERQNDSEQWKQQFAANMQKIGIVSIGLEGAEVLNEADLIPNSQNLPEMEIKVRKMMRTLGLWGKTIFISFVIKQLIFELIKHVFLTQYGQHYLIVNMSDNDLIYESNLMLKGKLSTFFKHSVMFNNPQAVLPAPLKAPDGTVIGVHVGHIASRSSSDWLDMPASVNDVENIVNRSSSNWSDVSTLIAATRGVIKFYPSKNFPNGTFIGWDVDKFSNFITQSQILASADFKGNLDEFAQLIDTAEQSCNSISSKGGMVTANIASNINKKDTIVSYGIICFSTELDKI